MEKDMLKSLFELQEALNTKIGRPLEPWKESINKEEPDSLLVAGGMLDDLIKAVSSELEELRDCTYWKHWQKEAREGKRYQIHDLKEAKKEVIDLLHFFISIALWVGMDAEELYDLYVKKNKINFKRQENDYSYKDKEMFNEEF